MPLCLSFSHVHLHFNAKPVQYLQFQFRENPCELGKVIPALSGNMGWLLAIINPWKLALIKFLVIGNDLITATNHFSAAPVNRCGDGALSIKKSSRCVRRQSLAMGRLWCRRTSHSSKSKTKRTRQNERKNKERSTQRLMRRRKNGNALCTSAGTAW